jgi:hypothetical protein
MTHEEILAWIETQKVPPASVLIVDDDVDDLDGLRVKAIQIKNIIGVVRRTT